MEWHVWDFPDTVRVYFNEDFRIELFRLLKGNESRNKLAKRFGVNTSTVKSYFQTGKDSEGLKTYITVKIIKKIPEILSIFTGSEFMKRLEKNIVAYRSRNGNSVINPILPITESPELYSIATHMICDGTAGKRKTPCYYNTSNELREEFIKSLQVFGKVKTNEYLLQSNVYAVMFPKAVTDILSHIFQVKFVRTSNLPNLFFTVPKNCQYAAIRAMFDDEGSVSKKGQLVFVNSQKGIMEDLKKLLDQNDLKTGKISFSRNMYTITVLSESKEQFLERIGLTHLSKKLRLTTTIELQKEKAKAIPIQTKIYDLLSQKGSLTRQEICKLLNTNFNYTTIVLYDLRKEGKIRSHFNGKNKPYLWKHA